MIKKLTLMSVTGFLCFVLKKNLHGRGGRNRVYITALIFSANALQAQPPALKPLTIGDTVPDMELTNLVNYKSTTARLSDFKDKLLILDFMNTSCIACIEALPGMNETSRKFKGHVQMVLVTPEDQSRINGFHANNIYGKQNKLTFMGEDTVLSALFPHQYIPHIVWINKGKVAAITYPEYVTMENIKRVAAGESPDWPVKREITTFDRSVPMLTINTSNIPEVSMPRQVYYSAISTYLSGIPKTYLKEYDSLVNRTTIRMLNYSIIDLYLLAFHKPVAYPKGRIILNVHDTSRFIFDPAKDFNQQWITNNTYGYEAVLPFTGSGIQQKIKADLDSYFNVSGSIIRQIMPCYTLVKIAGRTPLPFKRSGSKPTRQHSIGFLIKNLTNQRYGQIAINESGLPDSLMIGLAPESFADIDQLNEELLPYGLTLTLQNREAEVLFIEEKY